MSVISMKQLLEAGVHFGHQTRRWNPKSQHHLRLIPQLRRDDRREIVFVPELLLRFCVAEGFVDLVPLTFVADECPDIAFVPENTSDHGRVPEILLGNVILRIGKSFV